MGDVGGYKRSGGGADCEEDAPIRKIHEYVINSGVENVTYYSPMNG
jgi:hypothetical protein